MAKKTTIKMNRAGIVQLLKSQEVHADLFERGERILNALPDGKGEEWSLTGFLGYDRAQVVVRTANDAARRTAAEDMALIKALDAGR